MEFMRFKGIREEPLPFLAHLAHLGPKRWLCYSLDIRVRSTTPGAIHVYSDRQEGSLRYLARKPTEVLCNQRALLLALYWVIQPFSSFLSTVASRRVG